MATLSYDIDLYYYTVCLRRVFLQLQLYQNE